MISLAIPHRKMCKVLMYFLLERLIQKSVDRADAHALVGENVERAKNDEDYSFIVSLQRKNHEGSRENHFCGGALISSKHVLTAAHCLEHEIFENVEVMVGSKDLRGGSRYDVEKWVTFKQWTQEAEQTPQCASYDAAVLTLTEDINDSGIIKGTLTKADEFSLYGKTAVTAGWGFVLEEGKLVTPRYQMKAELKVIRKRDCSKRVQEVAQDNRILGSELLCTIAEPTNTIIVHGDSGGPLFIGGSEIIGVNSATVPQEIGHDLRAVNVHVNMEYIKVFVMEQTYDY